MPPLSEANEFDDDLNLGDIPIATEVQINRADLLYALRHDSVTFFSFYIGADLTLEVPDFHDDMWNELLLKVEQANIPATVRSLRKLFGVPREHSKSTIAKLAVILFLKYSPFAFAMYVSKTNAIAKNAIRDILIWLSSPAEVDLHGPMRVIKSSETDSLWIMDISIRDSVSQPPRIKRVILKAMGSDQQVRGLLILNRRPEIIVVDDIEDLDNTGSTQQQSTLDEWFMGSLMKSFARSHVVLFLGNMIRKTTLLARLAKESIWNPTVYGALVRDKHGELRPLWPGRWTVESLLQDYAEYRALGLGHVWEAEMMNLTQDEVLSQDMAGVTKIHTPMQEDLEGGIIILDPAFGQNAWNDDSAITVHARVRGLGVPAIVESWHGKATEEQLFDRMLEFSFKWGIATWGIEADAAQKLFIPYFNLLLQVRKLNQSLLLFLPLLTNRKQKSSRIIAFRRAVLASSYAVAESESTLLERLQAYDPQSSERDDLVDSASHGLTCWDTYGESINQRGISQVIGLIFLNNESNEIRQGIDVAGF